MHNLTAGTQYSLSSKALLFETGPDELEVLAAHAIVAEENNNIKVFYEPCLEELQKMLKYYGDLCEPENEPRTLIELS